MSQLNLKQIAEEVLTEESVKNPGKVCKKLNKIFSKASPELSFAGSQTDAYQGHALSPRAAKGCLINDPLRTVKYIQAGYDAIRAAMEKFPERPIRVLESGSGPYATLSMTLASLFEQGEVEFMALDIFEESIKCVYQISKVLGQSEKFPDLLVGDATTLSLEKLGKKAPHVVLCETMSPGLQVEPQVAITANFGDQMVEGGFFVPEKIDLSVAVAKLFPTRIKELGVIYSLTKEVSQRVKIAGRIDPKLLEMEQNLDVRMPLPEGLPRVDRLVLQTRLRLFGDRYLEPGESLITCPLSPFISEETRLPRGRIDWVRAKLVLGTAGSDPLKFSVGADSSQGAFPGIADSADRSDLSDVTGPVSEVDLINGSCVGNGNWLNFRRFSKKLFEIAQKFIPPGYPD